MVARETFVTNAFETTLSSSLGVGATTINVVDTTGSPAVPFYLVLEPGNDSKREVVLVDSSKSATTFVLSTSTNRGLDGTTDVAHDSGVPVKVVPIAALWTDINDRVDAKSDTTHTHAVAAADVSYAGSTNLAATNVEAALDELDAEKAATTHNHDSAYVNAQAGGQNLWVQSTAPTALETGDIWIDTA